VVTVESGLVLPGSAIVQDASAGILIRLDDEAGTLRRGQFVELDGVRSTRSGMLTLRVAIPPIFLGEQAEPASQRVATGSVAEIHEAELVTVRGAISSSLLRSTANNVSFTIDDGSGPLRVVFLARAGISTTNLGRNVWIEVRGVVGQETTGSLPDRGYRVWPRSSGDLRVLSGPTAAAGAAGGVATGGEDPGRGLIGGGVVRAPDLGVSKAEPGTGGALPGLEAGSPISRAGSDGSPGADDALLASHAVSLARQRTAAIALASLALLVLTASAAWWKGSFRRLHARLTRALRPDALDEDEPDGGTAEDADLQTPRVPLAVLPDVREREGP